MKTISLSLSDISILMNFAKRKAERIHETEITFMEEFDDLLSGDDDNEIKLILGSISEGNYYIKDLELNTLKENEDGRIY